MSAKLIIDVKEQIWLPDVIYAAVTKYCERINIAVRYKYF